MKGMCGCELTALTSWSPCEWSPQHGSHSLCHLPGSCTLLWCIGCLTTQRVSVYYHSYKRAMCSTLSCIHTNPVPRLTTVPHTYSFPQIPQWSLFHRQTIVPRLTYSQIDHCAQIDLFPNWPLCQDWPAPILTTVPRLTCSQTDHCSQTDLFPNWPQCLGQRGLSSWWGQPVSSYRPCYQWSWPPTSWRLGAPKLPCGQSEWQLLQAAEAGSPDIHTDWSVITYPAYTCWLEQVNEHYTRHQVQVSQSKVKKKNCFSSLFFSKLGRSPSLFLFYILFFLIFFIFECFFLSFPPKINKNAGTQSL